MNGYKVFNIRNKQVMELFVEMPPDTILGGECVLVC